MCDGVGFVINGDGVGFVINGDGCGSAPTQFIRLGLI